MGCSWNRSGIVTLTVALDCLLVGCGGVLNEQIKPPLTAPTLTWPTPAAIPYGTALSAAQLDATASVPGKFTYSPALGTVLPAGARKLSVTFAPADTADYTAATAVVSLQVNPVVSMLTWPAPAAIVYGTALGSAQLDASSGGLPGTFTYAPAAGVIPGAGADALSVTFTPSDTADYTGATASVTLTVSKATPTVIWTPSAAIAKGMALTAVQLDATANVGGSFVYLPAAGTMMNSSGQQTLQTTFTPADQADYNSVQASVELTVAPFGVVAWGDSLTVGDQGNIDQGAYPSELAALIDLPVVNEGVNANTPTTIGIREGGLPITVTVVGGTIPPSGSVNVTFVDGWAPVTIDGPVGGVLGSILGVPGVTTFDTASSTTVFTRTTPGEAVNAPGSPAFVVDNPYASWIPVFWEGRNDIADGARTISDLAAEVSVIPAGQTYLVLANINGNAPDEWIGTTKYEYIVDLNNQLASIYGSHYLDVRRLLISNYDPSQATDVADVNHDDVPTSLRAVYTTATLVDAIGPTDTVLNIEQSSLPLQIGTVLTIDTGAKAENALVSSLTKDTVTVERVLGGANVAHAAGALLTESNYFHLNAKGNEIVANAVAKSLSQYAIQAQKHAAAAPLPPQR